MNWYINMHVQGKAPVTAVGRGQGSPFSPSHDGIASNSSPVIAKMMGGSLKWLYGTHTHSYINNQTSV